MKFIKVEFDNKIHHINLDNVEEVVLLKKDDLEIMTICFLTAKDYWQCDSRDAKYEETKKIILDALEGAK